MRDHVTTGPSWRARLMPSGEKCRLFLFISSKSLYVGLQMDVEPIELDAARRMGFCFSPENKNSSYRPSTINRISHDIAMPRTSAACSNLDYSRICAGHQLPRKASLSRWRWVCARHVQTQRNAKSFVLVVAQLARLSAEVVARPMRWWPSDVAIPVAAGLIISDCQRRAELIR